jgi:hypothetical protein
MDLSLVNEERRLFSTARARFFFFINQQLEARRSIDIHILGTKLER